MSVSVLVPSPLRKFANNQKRIACEASNVLEAFEAIKKNNDALVEHILDEDKTVREFIRVFVNKSDISKKQGLSTPVNKGDTISIVPAFAGG